MRKLLTPAKANPKMAKSLAKIESAILHLAPVNLALRAKTVCPFASAGCRASCLNSAGRGAFQSVQDARVYRTRLFWRNRVYFLELISDEIAALERRAIRLGKTCAVRLNGTSDLPFEGFRLRDGKTLFDRFPNVVFYDYTKGQRRMLRSLVGTGPLAWPSNYRLTFSRSESNDAKCKMILEYGGTVAVVFSGALPSHCYGFPVIDGDLSDYRPADPAGSVVGLLAKGKAKRDASGFVVDPIRSPICSGILQLKDAGGS